MYQTFREEATGASALSCYSSNSQCSPLSVSHSFWKGTVTLLQPYSVAVQASFPVSSTSSIMSLPASLTHMYLKRARKCCLYRECQNRSIRIAAHPAWACPQHEQLHAPHKHEHACASKSLLSANSIVLSDPPRKRAFPAESLRHSGNFQLRGNMVPRVFTCSNQRIQRGSASPLRPLILGAMSRIFQPRCRGTG